MHKPSRILTSGPETTHPTLFPKEALSKPPQLCLQLSSLLSQPWRGDSQQQSDPPESGGQHQLHSHSCLRLGGHPTQGEAGQGILIQPWKGSQGCLWGDGQRLGHSVRRAGIALCSATDKLCNLEQVPSPVWDSVSPSCVTMMSPSCQAISPADFMLT